MLLKGVDYVSKCVFTKEEFYERINEAIQNDFDNGDYLIEFKAKYDFDNNNEWETFREVCSFCYGETPENDGVCWFNDWDEGQKDFMLLGVYSLENLLQMYKDVQSALQQFERAKVGDQ